MIYGEINLDLHQACEMRRVAATLERRREARAWIVKQASGLVKRARDTRVHIMICQRMMKIVWCMFEDCMRWRGWDLRRLEGFARGHRMSTEDQQLPSGRLQQQMVVQHPRGSNIGTSQLPSFPTWYNSHPQPAQFNPSKRRVGSGQAESTAAEVVFVEHDLSRGDVGRIGERVNGRRPLQSKAQ